MSGQRLTIRMREFPHQATKMSINHDGQGEIKVVEMMSLKTVDISSKRCQSTGFNVPTSQTDEDTSIIDPPAPVLPTNNKDEFDDEFSSTFTTFTHPPTAEGNNKDEPSSAVTALTDTDASIDPPPALTSTQDYPPPPAESTSDSDGFSSASMTSTDTGASTDVEEHRHLSQSLTSFSFHDCYSSFCNSTCSDSEQSCCSTLEGHSSFASVTGSLGECDDYSDSDGHYNLIQLPVSIEGEELEFWKLCDGDADSDSSSLDGFVKVYHPASQVYVVETGKEEKQEFCVQCHAWPDVADCRGKLIYSHDLLEFHLLITI